MQTIIISIKIVGLDVVHFNTYARIKKKTKLTPIGAETNISSVSGFIYALSE